MKKLVRLSPEVRQRAVAMYAEVRPPHSSDWSATPKVDGDRLAQLERENRELRRANEILKLASAFFAQAELDRKLK
jgi:transposase